MLDVIDPAEYERDGSTGEGPSRFVAVELAIANSGDATYQGQSPSRNAVLLDAEEQSHTNGFIDLRDCPGFGMGSLALDPGEVVVGCVPFLPPLDAELVTFEFTPDGEGDSATARVDIEGYTTGDAPARDDLRDRATP